MADAHGSGPCVRKDVGVQLPPRPLAWSPQSQVGFTQVLARVAAGGPHNAGRRTGQVVSEPARAQQQLPRTRRRTRPDKTTREYVVGQAVQLAGSLLILVPFHAVPVRNVPVRDLRLGNRLLALPLNVGGAGRRPRSGLRAGPGRHHRARCGDPAGRGGGAARHPRTRGLRAPEGLGTAAAVLLSGSLCRADRTGKAGGSGPLDAAHVVPPCGFGVGRDGRSGAQAHLTPRMSCLLAGSGSDGTVGRGLRPT
jgi:hypothetical protein